MRADEPDFAGRREWDPDFDEEAFRRAEEEPEGLPFTLENIGAVAAALLFFLVSWAACWAKLGRLGLWMGWWPAIVAAGFAAVFWRWLFILLAAAILWFVVPPVSPPAF